jgi:hypothetical protein
MSGAPDFSFWVAIEGWANRFKEAVLGLALTAALVRGAEGGGSKVCSRCGSAARHST